MPATIEESISRKLRSVSRFGEVVVVPVHMMRSAVQKNFITKGQ